MLDLLEHRLHPISAFVIIPLFALANAGVAFETDALAVPHAGRLAAAVGFGLLVGKVLGIAGVTVLARRLRLGALPAGVTTRYVWGLAALAGIGFTVSLFISDLAYPQAALTDAAKIGIMAGSLAAALLGTAILFLGRHPRPSSRHGAERENMARTPAPGQA